jgi:hypothetical protein
MPLLAAATAAAPRRLINEEVNMPLILLEMTLPPKPMPGIVFFFVVVVVVVVVATATDVGTNRRNWNSNKRSGGSCRRRRGNCSGGRDTDMNIGEVANN